MARSPTDTTSRAPLPRNVVLLGATSLVNDIATEMAAPLLPKFVIDVLKGDRFDVGLIEGVADSVSSLLKLFVGKWSDRLSRRKTFVVAGYTIACLLRPFMGLVTTPWQALLVRTGDRLGKGVRAAPRDALIADSTPRDQRGRAFGFHRGMDHLGAAIGPLLATCFLWFWPGSLRVLFVLSVVPGIFVIAVVSFGLTESPRSTSTPARGDGDAARRPSQPLPREFWRYLAALVVFTLGNSSDLFLVVRAEELGVPAVWLPSLWFAFHVVKSAGNMLAGNASDRLGYRPMIFLGWGLYAAVYVAFGLASAWWHAWGLFLAYGLFFALTEPAEKALVALLVRDDMRGLAYGWFNMAIGIAALPASLLFGLLYDRAGAGAAFGTGAALAAVAAAMLLAVKPPVPSSSS